ncbi:glutaredoxin [Pyrococcus kukulkanii]|uniref:glutaredoxin n=1 Tax=Pyrococcus kukulkanii TaxID=1609559 RepID=UPI000F1B9E58|nr:MAG: glutaredoxin [Thermococci archaeon]
MGKAEAIMLAFLLIFSSLGCISSTQTSFNSHVPTSASPQNSNTTTPSTDSSLQSTTPSQTSGTITSTSESWLEGLDKSKFHFYIYGLDTCPHCQRMKKLLPEYFGDNSVTFYEVRSSEKNLQLYYNFSRLIGVQGVPLVGIFYDGKLYAIIEGEIEPRLIPKLVKEAMKNKGVILIISAGQYILPFNNTKAVNAINNLTQWFKEGVPES